MSERLLAEAGPTAATLHALLKGLTERLGMDYRSLESQEMKQIPSTQKTITEESSEQIKFDEKRRYHMTSKPFKKPANSINKDSP